MAEIETEDFIPTQWQRVTSKPKPRKSIGATEAKDGLEVALARGEITLLLKAEKDCQFDLGRLFKTCRDKHARGRTGIYIKLLHQVKTSWKKADRLIKFYERELRVMVAKRRQKSKVSEQLASWGIEDVDALDRKLNSQEQDDLIVARKLKLEREKQRIVEAKERQKQRTKDSTEKRKQTKAEEKAEETAPQLVGRIEIEWALSDEEFEIFREAWMSLGNEESSLIIFKAVTDAVAGRQGK